MLKVECVCTGAPIPLGYAKVRCYYLTYVAKTLHTFRLVNCVSASLVLFYTVSATFNFKIIFRQIFYYIFNNFFSFLRKYITLFIAGLQLLQQFSQLTIDSQMSVEF